VEAFNRYSEAWKQVIGGVDVFEQKVLAKATEKAQARTESLTLSSPVSRPLFSALGVGQEVEKERLALLHCEDRAGIGRQARDGDHPGRG
jgi:hypothetical protein